MNSFTKTQRTITIGYGAGFASSKIWEDLKQGWRTRICAGKREEAHGWESGQYLLAYSAGPGAS